MSPFRVTHDLSRSLKCHLSMCSGPFTWFDICRCVSTELFPVLSIKIRECLDEILKEKPKKAKLLNEHGDKIIEHFRTSGIDQERLEGMSNKDLSVPLAEYCGEKKVKGISGGLLKNMKAQMKERKEETTVNNQEENRDKQISMAGTAAEVTTEPVNTPVSKPTVADGYLSGNEEEEKAPSVKNDDDFPEESPEPEDEDEYKIKRIGGDEV